MATQIGINKKGAKMARHTSDQTTYKILSSGAWIRMSSKNLKSKNQSIIIQSDAGITSAFSSIG